MAIDDLHTLFVGQVPGVFMHCLRQTIVRALISDIWTVTAIQHFQLGILAETLEVTLCLLDVLAVHHDNSLLKGYPHRIGILGNRDIRTSVGDIGAELAGTDDDGLALVHTKLTRQPEELKGFLQVMVSSF